MLLKKNAKLNFIGRKYDFLLRLNQLFTQNC